MFIRAETPSRRISCKGKTAVWATEDKAAWMSFQEISSSSDIERYFITCENNGLVILQSIMFNCVMYLTYERFKDKANTHIGLLFVLQSVPPTLDL